MSLRICVTTSDKYHHILPVFLYLYQKYWNAPFDLVGYAKPDCPLPDNCTWVSMGEQGAVSDWSTDLRKYFDTQPDWFVWIMEDTLLRQPINMPLFANLPMRKDVGKICLTSDVSKREHTSDGYIVHAHPDSRYRLSMQPSIWNRNYLLQYITDGMDPWEFETQDPKNDGWEIVGFVEPPVVHNEGVTRHDIFKLNLDGMREEDIMHIKQLASA